MNFDAPWDNVLKFATTLVIALFVWIAWMPPYEPEWIVLLKVVLPLAILGVSWALAPAGYRLEGDELIVKRNLGPEIFSALYGCPLHFGDYGTSWTDPILDNWSLAGQLHLDWDHPYLKALDAMTDAMIATGRGKFITGMTDWHPGGDAVAAFRDPEKRQGMILEASMLEMLWPRLVLRQVKTKANKKYVGKTLAEIGKLRGEEVRAFMDACKSLAEMVCERRVIEQKVSDDAKASFLKRCTQDEVGR